jgi:uncharacterized protein YbjT (DUF2867 family)
MRVLLFGATGMIGQGVLRECLLDPEISGVQTVGRRPTGKQHPKLQDFVHRDLWHYQSVKAALSGFDACFFCLGVSSLGMEKAEYRRITYGITLAAAETLCRVNPGMTFVYVSGAGTDSSGQGRSAWARVKGQTENALLRLPFKAAYMFRPGLIQPLDGIRSKTRVYRFLYGLAALFMPLLRKMFPNFVLTTEQIGRAMIAAARYGAPKRVLESRDIRALAAGSLGS